MLFNESCKTGRLQVDTRIVKVVSGKQLIWSIPRSAITYIAVKQSAMLADLTIYTADQHFPAHILTRQASQRFLALFPRVPHGAPPASPPLQTSAPSIAQHPRWNATPTTPFQGPVKKKPPLWAYVVSIVAVLACCGCIGSFMVNAFSHSGTTTQTPPALPTSGHTVTLAATATKAAPTRIPTVRPTPTPSPKPTPKPVPTQPPTQPPSCQGINGNPWCYNFTPGNLIYNPPSNFCSYFNCISSFWEPDDPGDGYVIQCQDGTYSQSGGERGACSYHGGEMRPLYAH